MKPLSLFVYIHNTVCVIYIHRIPYAKLFDAVYSHVEFCTASSWDSVSTVLPVICAYRQGNLYHEHLLDQQ